ncbi:Uncharacterised protein [Gordonia bronchialis]|nr:Uncharacterised protein [Gordonia bronchialis]
MAVRFSTTGRMIGATMLGLICAASVLVGTASNADAAPAGRPNAGVPLSSVVYGTGCTYPVTLAVNSSGWVAFYEQRTGYPPIFVGRDLPSGALASITWVPRRIGDRYLYAVQNGVKSPKTLVRVRQGYGSNGLCFGV